MKKCKLCIWYKRERDAFNDCLRGCVVQDDGGCQLYQKKVKSKKRVSQVMIGDKVWTNFLTDDDADVECLRLRKLGIMAYVEAM